MLAMSDFDSDMRCAYVDIGRGAGVEYKGRQKGGGRVESSSLFIGFFAWPQYEGD